MKQLYPALQSARSRILSVALDLTLGRSSQERLGHFILRRVRGEDNDNPETNGEYALVERLARSTKRRVTIFDVGANKGDWSIRAHTCFGVETMLYAFEPVRETHAYLEARLRGLKPPGTAHAMHLALGDKSGFSEINMSGELAGSNSLHIRNGIGVRIERKETVRIQTGDEFCREHSLNKVDLLKIDTEGHDMAVLVGFGSLFATRSIGTLQFEYGGTWIDSGYYLRDAFRFLSANGYRLGRLMPTYVDWIASYHQKYETFRYSNWVATAQDVNRAT